MSGGRVVRVPSTRTGPSRSSQPDSRIADYEYFQLYDPEDSDIADEDDPDVRNLLSGNLWNGSGQRRIIKNGLIADLFRNCCFCCFCKPYSW